MTNNYDADDLARLQALEHLVSTTAFMLSINIAQNTGELPSQVALNLKVNIVGSLDDTRQVDQQHRKLLKGHLNRLTESVVAMAKNADMLFGKK